MKILVNKKGNYSQLRLLFPQLQIATEYPVYSKYIFSTFDYDVPEQALFLLQSPAGVALDTLTGLCTFLKQVNYMASSKIERLAKTESFGDKELVYAMYHEAISLKISNRSYLQQDVESVATSDILSMSLYDQVSLAERLGPDKVYSQVINALEKYYSRDGSLTRNQYELYTKSLLGFNTANFKKSFKLTGDMSLDCASLFTYLPHSI